MCQMYNYHRVKAEEKAKEKQMEKSLKLLELILRPLLVYQILYRL